MGFSRHRLFDAYDGTGSATSVPMTQTDGDWGKLSADTRVGEYGIDALPEVSKGDTVTVTVASNGSVTFA